jgi:sugar lactone lactonase YvrE
VSGIARLASDLATLRSTLAHADARTLGGTGAAMGGLARRLAVVLAIAAALLALAVAPAFAGMTHAFSSSFGSAGAGAGQLSLVSNSGVAVNSTTGDVYVADTGNARVDQFDSGGSFVRAWGFGVADGLPAFETCTLSCQAGVQGSGAGQFTTPTFVAVDNSGGPPDGDVYVADTATNLVQKFDASGALVSAWGAGGQLDGSAATLGPFGSLGGIAVDSGGSLWAFDTNVHFFEFADDSSFTQDFDKSGNFGVSAAGLAVDAAGNLYFARGFPVVEVLSTAPPNPPGTELGQITDGSVTTTGLAVDQASGDIYADDAGSVIRRYDSSCAPSGSGCTPADSFGSGDLSGAAGLAVDAATGTLYAADTGNGRIAAFSPVTLADVTTGAASSVGPTSATLNGSVNPVGVQLTDCHFDYGTTTAYGQSAPCIPDAGSIGADSSEHAVSADIPGLDPGVTYHFRLVAANANGPTDGLDSTFNTPPPPSIESATATNITATSADLNARINPGGSDTTYHFEYGTSTSYGTSVPVPDADIGSGTADVAVTTHLTGLSANTTYHWRVLATNPSGTVGAGADHTFIYDSSGVGLPDNRAYEMVTPPQKNGALIGGISITALFPDIALDGQRVVAASIQCFAGATSCNGSVGTSVGTPYSFTRTSAGWLTTPLAPPATQFPESTTRGYAADTGAALFSMPTAPSGEDDFYKREADGSFVDIGPNTAPSDGARGPSGGFTANKRQVQTLDLSHLIWSDQNYHWPFDGTVGGGFTVYEYAGSANTQPLLVGVGGPNDGPGSSDLISACQTAAGPLVGSAPGIISADGRTVFFTAFGDDDSACTGVGPVFGTGANSATPVPADALYVRIDGDRSSAHTVAISARSAADCTTPACTGSSPGDALFAGASTDGSKAFFTDTQQLTDDASQDSTGGDSAVNACRETSGPNGCNLYLYDFGAPAGHELTAVSAGDSSGGGPRVQGVAAISPDGSHAYFVAKGVLTTTANAQGQAPSDGADNLYAYERDAANPAGRLAFIATLADSHAESIGWISGAGAPANVTPDGRFLVFTSSNRLTADDSSRSGAQQVFRYDAQTGQLIRISVGEGGFNDNGNRSAPTPCELNGCPEDATVSAPHFVLNPRANPTMSDDGAYVFFDSPVGLTPRALDAVRIGTNPNGNPIYAQNIYEWHAGRVALISDGRDTSQNSGTNPACPGAQIGIPSSTCLLGTDASGQNVFFTTPDALVAQDTDTELDYYDARVCAASSPCIQPPAPPAPACGADTCHAFSGPVAPASEGPTVTFSGPGNAKPGRASAKVKVLNHVVHGSTFILTVTVPAKGRITVAGAGIKTVRRAISKAGTHRIAVALTHKEKTLLKRKRRLTLEMKLRFSPSGGSPSSITVPVTVKA